MKFTFPNMGNLSTIFGAFMKSLGADFIEPAPTTEKTVRLGTKYAPSDACMPMKIVLGNFIEAYEMGADTAIFFGGRGPCCFGYFAESFELIFRQNGMGMKVLTFEYDVEGIKTAAKFLSEVSEKSLLYCLSQIPTGFRCAELMDQYEQAIYDKRAEISGAENKKRLDAFIFETALKLKSANSLDHLLIEEKKAIRELSALQSDTAPQMKIGVVGDIYSVIDPFMNKKIQSVLADMGAYTKRSMSISGFLNDKILRRRQRWKSAADEFLPAKVGGFARETVGNAALWAKEGFDGIIEVYPMNCMPESVARSILPKVSEKYDTPVLTLVVDEMSGETGYITRLEAFTQMILRKKDACLERAVFRD